MTPATQAQRRVAERLAVMASDAAITYTPTYYVEKYGHVVWHQVTARTASQTWTYWLRREYGSYAGGF